MNIIGEQIQSYVAKQINLRQKAHGSGVGTDVRTPDVITYLNSKTAWVKLASGVNVSSGRLQKDGIQTKYSDIELSKNNILFAGTSKSDTSTYNLTQRGTSTLAYDNLYGSDNGIYNVNNSTNAYSPEFGLVPMPGIESAEIKCLNRGSIKKATVKIKCYSPEQFRTINLLYLRLGYTVLLEWGNSLFLDNDKDPQLITKTMKNTLVEDAGGIFSTNSSNRKYNVLLRKIQQKRSTEHGNYDGLVAKVVNFSWDFTSDGAYDITLELISLGDIVESLKVNITPNSKLTKFIKSTYILYNEEIGNETKDINPAPINNIISSYLFLQKLYLNQQDGKDEWGVPSPNDQRQAQRDITAQVNGVPVEIGAQWIKSKGVNLTIQHREFYTRGYLLNDRPSIIAEIKKNHPSAIELSESEGNAAEIDIKNAPQGISFCIWSTVFYEVAIYHNYDQSFYQSSGISDNDVCYFNYLNGENDNNINDLGFYMRLGHLLNFVNTYVIPVEKTRNEKQTEISTGIFRNKMHTFPYQVSLDPRVCIVHTSEKVNTKEFFRELLRWKEDGNDYALTMNIYVNHMMIQSSLDSNIDDKGNINLFEFLSTICTELNKALGGINNLEPVVDEEFNSIHIIDHNYQPSPTSHPYELELYGYNGAASNFVRSFNLKTEITPEFATMATIGSTAGGYTKGVENTMFSKWNKGITDRYKEEYVAADPDSRDKPGDIPEAVEHYLNDFYDKEGSNPFGWTELDVGDWDIGDNTQDLNDEIIDNNIATVTEFFKYCQAYIQNVHEEKYSSPHNGFIPISLGITMDGISGIKIYNALNVSTKFLPSDYPDSLQFIVKGVNHKISNQDWETTLETIVISKSENGSKTSPSKALTYAQIKSHVDTLLTKYTATPWFTSATPASSAPTPIINAVKSAVNTVVNVLSGGSPPVPTGNFSSTSLVQGCPSVKNELNEPIVDSKIVYSVYCNRKGVCIPIRGKVTFIAKVEAAQAELTPQGITLKIGDSTRTLAFQTQAQKTYLKNLALYNAGQSWIKNGKPHRGKPAFTAAPCEGYHVRGQAMDIDQGGTYKLNGKTITYREDIESKKGIIYNALTRQGLKRVPGEWYHWSYGEAR
jgi:hypothetical protein